MKKDIFITESRRKTPWTGDAKASALQQFIDTIIQERYEERHPRPERVEESTLLNSYKPESCPHCGSSDFIKYGYDRNGHIRYRCNECGRTFNILTGTLFQDHKISITEWIDFCLGLFGYQSFSSISRSHRNSYTTTKYWIAKILILLEDYQESIVLSGDVYIDETYYAVRKSDKELKEDGKEYAGLSRNQICIGVGNDGKKSIALVEGKGKCSMKSTWNTFSGHIAEGSHLIHDSENSHRVLVAGLGLTETVYNANSLKGLPDDENPLNQIFTLNTAPR